MPRFLEVTAEGTLTEYGEYVLEKSRRRVETQGCIIGDSHAAYWPTGPASTTWGIPVTSDGIAGQQSIDLIARLGGLPPRITVTGDMLPSIGWVTVTAMQDADGTGIRPLRTGTTGEVTREGFLNGAPVTLRTTDLGVSYSVKRSTAGPAIPVPPGTPLVMGQVPRASVPIILPPRNDVGKNEAATLWRAPLETILARYRALVDWVAPDGRFIMLSMLPWADESEAGKVARKQLDAAFRDEWPQQWLDWAGFLRTDAAFAAAGAPKTSQDQIDIINGFTPTSFRRPSDTGHLNDSGYVAADAFLTPAVAAA